MFGTTCVSLNKADVFTKMSLLTAVIINFYYELVVMFCSIFKEFTYLYAQCVSLFLSFFIMFHFLKDVLWFLFKSSQN